MMTTMQLDVVVMEKQMMKNCRKQLEVSENEKEILMNPD
jgi:hypothetical protein